jgi:hypothetical protein
MSLQTKCLTCDGGWTTLAQLLKSCLYVDTEGNQFFNIKFIECSSEDTPAVSCNGGMKTLEELFKGSIVTNGCNQCALLVGIDQASIDLICADCNAPRQ